MEMGRPVEEVEAVIGFFYKALRQELSSLSSTVILVENLGNFYVKEKCLDTTINTIEKLIDGTSNKTIREYTTKQELKESVDKMINLKTLLQAERERRVGVIKKRYNNESDKDLEN
jgi:nucleoid DNA-binding protein